MIPVLVTGGAGFVGSHVCKILRQTGFLPVAFDNLCRGNKEAVRFGPLVEGDILSATALDDAMRRYQPEAVLHFAAFAYVGESIERPLDYYRNNVAGLINVLESMSHHGVKKVVFSSTCATYGMSPRVCHWAGPVRPRGQRSNTTRFRPGSSRSS